MAKKNRLSSRMIVGALAVAETLVWAAFFYMFPALLGEWERDLGWSKTELSGALTLALVVSAFLAPVAGRMIDRGRSRLVLTGSTVMGGMLLLALSQVSVLWQFYLIWFCLGFVMAGALYEPCFVHLTKIFGVRAKSAITLVALVAGLAGTVAFPGANILASSFGWRGAVIVFALVVCLLAAPLMWIATPTIGSASRVRSCRSTSDGNRRMSATLHAPVFWYMAFAFSMIAFDHGMIITHLLPLLDDRGIQKEAAILAAAMIGPTQVIGRLLMTATERYIPMVTIFFLTYIFMAAACVALYGAGTIILLLAVFVLFHGTGYGVTSITRPTITARFLGREGFGAISGALAIPYIATFAAAPTIAALLWEIGGYDLVIIAGFVSCLLGLVAFLFAVKAQKLKH